MMKLTKRKSFSFYRSYYDVFNELEYQDKLDFIEALLDKQFLDIDPDLNKVSTMVKFAYISQMDSIEKQVKGYCDKTKTQLNNNKSYPWQGGDTTPKEGGADTPTLQEKEKEKEKEELTTVYENFVDEIKKGAFASRIESLYMRLKLKHGTLTPLLKEFKLHLIEENRLHKDTNDFFINFKNWLNVQDRINKLDKYR